MALTLISDLPATVVGVEAHEKVTAEDYESVLVPAVQPAEAASANGKVRVLFVVGPDSEGLVDGHPSRADSDGQGTAGPEPANAECRRPSRDRALAGTAP